MLVRNREVSLQRVDTGRNRAGVITRRVPHTCTVILAVLSDRLLSEYGHTSQENGDSLHLLLSTFIAARIE